MGETTFGKGLVQAQFSLVDGSALLLTIAHYYTPSGRLIQRDYSHSSMIEYYSARPKDGAPTPTDDVKATDSGRKVFGGGGITPDEKYTRRALTRSSATCWLPPICIRISSFILRRNTSAPRNRRCRAKTGRRMPTRCSASRTS